MSKRPAEVINGGIGKVPRVDGAAVNPGVVKKQGGQHRVVVLQTSARACSSPSPCVENYGDTVPSEGCRHFRRPFKPHQIFLILRLSLAGPRLPTLMYKEGEPLHELMNYLVSEEGGGPQCVEVSFPLNCPTTKNPIIITFFIFFFCTHSSLLAFCAFSLHRSASQHTT